MNTSSTILIVDDEPNLRCTLSLIFKRAGHSVTIAGSGTEARRHLEMNAYDLVFLDLKMPDVDGQELLPEIRKLHPETPVLILTAHASLESAIEAVRNGARDYLLKPIDPAQILARVEEILSESKGPIRRRQIVGEIQGLLAELNAVQQAESTHHPGSRVLPGSPLIRPTPTNPARYLHCGPFLLDLHARHLTCGARFIPLTPTTFDYLATLVRHSPNPIPYETLVLESQGYHSRRIEAQEVARWRIHELRKAIEPDPRQPRYLITVRGVGYRLVT